MAPASPFLQTDQSASTRDLENAPHTSQLPLRSTMQNPHSIRATPGGAVRRENAIDPLVVPDGGRAAAGGAVPGPLADGEGVGQVGGDSDGRGLGRRQDLEVAAPN